MEEFWKVCIFSENYLISNLGNIQNIKNGKFLNAGINSEGYKSIGLSINKKPKRFNIHRLLMLTFKSNEYFDGAVVNHKDGNKLNNNLDNLEWCTVKENNIHAIKIGLKNLEYLKNIKRPILKGETNGRSKLKEFQIKEIKELYEKGMFHKDIAKIYNVSRVCITQIINNKKWKHV